MIKKNRHPLLFWTPFTFTVYGQKQLKLMSSFVFCRIKKFIQVWNKVMVRKMIK